LIAFLPSVSYHLTPHRPFCATFLNFIGYALGAVRVSALSNMGIVYVMTHDSIGLGE
jgi:transketolase